MANEAVGCGCRLDGDSGARGENAMLQRLILVVALMLASTVRADIIYIRDLELAGQATVTASAWDIGHKDALFDRDWNNIYRSASINPAIITVEFTQQRAVGAMRALVAASPHNITIEAANTLADLDAQTGTWVRVLNAHRVEDSVMGWAEWNDAPVTRRVWRFIVQRLERDDFVHIRELELQSPEPTEEVVINGQTVRINTIELSPTGTREIPIGNTIQYTAEASLSYGPVRYDVTSIAGWSPTNQNVATVAGGLATAVGVGSTGILAQIGVVQAQTTLNVRAVRPVDLNVGFIHRSPEYERFRINFNGDQRIQTQYLNQQKWPAPGELVTWTGHVFNKGDVPAYDVPFEWRFNGVLVNTGVIPVMQPGERMLLTYQRPWPADAVQTVDINPGAEVYQAPKYQRAIGNHTIELTLDPENTVEESSLLNNTRKDYINAIQFHFYIDQHTYDDFSIRPNFIETYSPEDWAQLQMLALQRKLWISGGRQRFRLAMLEVVPDGTLDPGGTHEPIGNVTWTTDGVWGFDWPVWYIQAFIKKVDHALVHELAHQIGLIDIYNYDVATQNMLIRHNGQLVAGTALMPLVSPWNVAYGNERYFYHNGVARIDATGRGAMANTGARFFSRGSVAGMNRNLGLRRGFYGDYLGAIPQGPISIKLRNFDGSPVANAALRIFQRDRNGVVPNTPKFSGTTNAQGQWTFPNVTLPGWNGGMNVNNPWSSRENNNTFNAPDPVGRNALLVLEAVWTEGVQQVVEYHFLEVDDVNIAFAAGQQDQYTFDIMTHRSRQSNALPTLSFTSGDTVTVAEGGMFSMRVLASDANGDPITLRATPIENGTFNPEDGRFVFNPDSLQVTNANGYSEPHHVLFTADDGKFRTTRTLVIHVPDTLGFAMLHTVVPDEPLPCLADINADGILDFFDVQAFLHAYSTQNPVADFNGDGILDFFDVQMYLNAYSAGCP